MDRYFSISTYTARQFCAWSGIQDSNISLLPNAIHLNDYSQTGKSKPLIDRLGINGRRVLLTFGRLVSQDRAKGFDEVLDVMPELLSTDSDLVYVIAGDGPDRTRLERRVSELDLGKNVIFAGFVEEVEKADLYRLSDVYVMPSRGEGFGFVFLEAMACGVPVIASEVDGSRDAVRDGAIGEMVNPDDRSALIAAIRRALEMPRGVVPEGLAFFDYTNFQKRANAILDQTVATR